jgi:hypothetical protein
MNDTQGGLAALWYILQTSCWMALALFGATVAALPALSQDDGLAAYLNFGSCYLLIYMFAFTESRLVTLLSRCLKRCGSRPPRILTIVLIVRGLWQFFTGHPQGIFWALVGCIIALGLHRLEAASTPAMDDYQDALRDGEPLLDVLQPDESGKSDDPDHPSEPEQSADPEPTLVDLEQPNDAQGSASAKKVAKPMTRARSWRRFFCFLALLVTLSCWGLMLAQIAVDILANSIVAGPIVSDDTRVLAPEVLVELNMTKVFPASVPVSTPDFITTLGSPCQVAPTPAPVAKSARIAVAVSTPMPTPEPTPTALPEVEPESEPEPEPEPSVLPGEAFRIFQLMFDMHMAQAKSLLPWWFDLPTEHQYAAIAVSLVVAWTLFPFLAWMLIGSAGLAMASFASASLFRSLRGHGLTRGHSLIICMAAGLAFTISIKAGFFFLLQLSKQSWSNAAGLYMLTDDFEKFKKDTETSASKVNGLALSFKKTMRQVLTATGQHATKIAQHATRIAHLESVTRRYIDIFRQVWQALEQQASALAIHETWMERFTKALRRYLRKTLNRLVTVLEQHAARITRLESWRRNFTKRMDSLDEQLSQLQATEADPTGLHEARKEMQEIRTRFNELENAEADAQAFADLQQKLDNISREFSNLQQSFDKLKAHVDDLEAESDRKLLDQSKAITDSICGVTRDLLDLKTKSNQRMSDGEEKSEAMQQQVNALEDSKASKEDLAPLKDDVVVLKGKAEKSEQDQEAMQERLNTLDESKASKEDLEPLKDDLIVLTGKAEKLEQDQEDMRKQLSTLEASNAAQEGLDQLRSDTTQQRSEAMQAAKELGASVGDVRKEMTAVDSKHSTQHAELESNVNEQVRGVRDDLDKQAADTKKCLDGLESKIGDVQRTQSEQPSLDDLVRIHMDGRLQEQVALALQTPEILASIINLLLPAVQNAWINHMQGAWMQQIEGAAWNVVKSEAYSQEVQNRIASLFQQQLARDNTPPDAPPGLSSGGRASSPDTDPSDSTDSNRDHDDPSGAPATVSSEGGGTNTPGDVEADPNTGNDPHNVPSGMKKSRHAPADGAASDGPSGDGSTPLPSDEGGDNGATREPKETEPERGRPLATGPGNSSVGDSTVNNGAPGGKKGNTKTRRRDHPQDRAAADRKAKRMAILDGKHVIESGKVVNSDGVIFGCVVDGDVPNMVGLKCNENREILSESGDVVGHATLDIAILNGMKANIHGYVVDSETVIFGRVSNPTGKMREWVGYVCNDKGELLSPSGDVVDTVYLWEHEEGETPNTSTGNNGNMGKKNKQPQQVVPHASPSGSGKTAKPSGLGGSKWGPSSGNGGGSPNGRNVSSYCSPPLSDPHLPYFELFQNEPLDFLLQVADMY